MLAGVLALDASAAAPESLEPMIAESGGGAGRSWDRHADGRLAVAASLPIAATVGSSGEAQVLVAGSVVLYNRDELCDLLANGGGESLRPCTDAELVLLSYQRWGVDCVGHLVGDFAFAVWDAARQRLLCVRDPLGVRQLTYSLEEGRLIFATRCAAVAVGRRAPVAPRRELLRDLLFKRYERQVTQTAYAGVLRLPAGHLLLASAAGLRVRRYWPNLDAAASSGSEPGRFAAQFRDLLTQSVRARMVDPAPVGLLLSGGLDSSSIACLADRLPAAGRLRAVSALYPLSPAADEREHLQTVAEHCHNLPVATIDGDCCPLAEDIAGEESAWIPDEPLVEAGSPLLRALLDRVREKGCRVVLSGAGGDQALVGDAYYSAGLSRDVPWLRLTAELPHFIRFSGIAAWQACVGATLGRFLPNSWFHRIAGGLRRHAGREAPRLGSPKLGSNSARLIWRELSGGLAAARSATLDQLASDKSMEWRFPFLDSRIVALCLSLPAGRHFGDGFDKALLREAMVGVLPESIRSRTRPAHFSEPERRQVDEWNRGIIWARLREALVERYGLLSPAEFDDAAMFQGVQAFGGSDHRRFLLMLAVSTWLRQCEARFGPRWTEDAGDIS